MLLNEPQDAGRAYGALISVLTLGAGSTLFNTDPIPGSNQLDLFYFVSLAVCTHYIGAHRSLNSPNRAQVGCVSLWYGGQLATSLGWPNLHYYHADTPILEMSWISRSPLAPFTGEVLMIQIRYLLSSLNWIRSSWLQYCECPLPCSP